MRGLMLHYPLACFPGDKTFAANYIMYLRNCLACGWLSEEVARSGCTLQPLPGDPASTLSPPCVFPIPTLPSGLLG